MQRIAIRIGDAAYKRLIKAKGEKTLSDFIRDTIDGHVRTEEHNKNAFIQIGEEIKEGQKKTHALVESLRPVTVKKEGPTAMDLLKDLQEKMNLVGGVVGDINNMKNTLKTVLSYVARKD